MNPSNRRIVSLLAAFILNTLPECATLADSTNLMVTATNAEDYCQAIDNRTT